jgi:Ala-tRNA(Pro) deacylase
MTCKDRLEAYLREQQVPFEMQQHRATFTAQDVAAIEHIPGKLVAKVVIAFADSNMIMLVLPASRRVDLARVREEIGAQEVVLAGEREIAMAFRDCEVGAMPPFGNLYGVPVYVDQQLTEDDTIAFQAGTHTDTMHMKYADYARLVQPTIADFARHFRELEAPGW